MPPKPNPTQNLQKAVLEAESDRGLYRTISKDFKEFLQCLNDRGVEYLVIGGQAVGLDGIAVEFISLADLKRNKLASGRNKDLADLDNP